MTSQAITAIGVSARGAGALFDLSDRQWWRLNSSGRCPAPAARIGQRVRWDRDELAAWWAAGCPSRAEWEKLKAPVSMTGAANR